MWLASRGLITLASVSSDNTKAKCHETGQLAETFKPIKNAYCGQIKIFYIEVRVLKMPKNVEISVMLASGGSWALKVGTLQIQITL